MVKPFDDDAKRLLAVGEKFSTPLQKCLVARALENNTALSEETKTKLAGLELPDNKDDIVSQFTTIRSESARAGFATVKGEAAGCSALWSLRVTTRQWTISSVV